MRRLLAIALLTLLPFAAPAQQNDTSNPVIARMAQLVEAFNARDPDALAAIYAPDAVLLLPGQNSIIGRDAIRDQYAQTFQEGETSLQFMTFDIRGFDQNATEIGETVMILGDRRIVGRYMHLWEVIEGEILLTRDMFHVLLVE